MIRVLVVDDHPVMRAGLVHVLNSAADIEVVGEVEDGRAALEHPRLAEVDVLLLDLAMPGLDGLAVLTELGGRGGIGGQAPRTLVLTSFGEDARVLAAMDAGASGFLFKDAPAAEVLDGIRRVHRGETVLSAGAAAGLLRAAHGPQPPSVTPRELDILRLVAVGTSNASIGRRLFITEATVKTHLQHIYDKLGASDRTHAVTLARDSGLL